MEYLVGFILGLVFGVLAGASAGWWLWRQRARASADGLAAVQEQMREAFSSLAAAALDANTARLAERSATTLDGKKQLIDQSLTAMNERLNKLADYFRTVENERKTEFGRLSGSVTELSRTTGELHQVLASTKRRGAWGERMADDILRLAGLTEKVNYVKQSSADAESGIPDFTFYLPHERKVNMDVKFPLENYRAFLDAEGDDARGAALEQLCRDVRGHITAVSRRGYVDTKGGTVPYVIVFLPSEQIFSLVLGAQPDLADDALAKSVVLASPMTLYAMLSVIRQAAELSNLMQTADDVLDVLADFSKQWTKYNEELDALGAKIEAVDKQYKTVATTRTNMLQRQINRIEDLRSQREEEGSRE